MLEMSAKFVKHLFPNARLAICHNNLSGNVRRKIQAIGRGDGVELVEVTGMLPQRLIKADAKNSWWKYALPRLDHDSYEIILDNDVIMWSLPPTISNAVKEKAFVALTDAAGRFYGDFDRRVHYIDPRLRLNAGLIGLPPGFSPDFDLLEGTTLTDFFHSEQGFTAMIFLTHEGPKRLVPLCEIQQLNVSRILPEELISNHSGGHFCGCSYGHYDFWEKMYAPVVENRYLEVSLNADSHD